MKKGYWYIIGGVALIGVASGLFFWRRGKGKSKIEKEDKK
jgi:LPXTG-motif cell wall-anchored protein